EAQVERPARRNEAHELIRRGNALASGPDLQPGGTPDVSKHASRLEKIPMVARIRIDFEKNTKAVSDLRELFVEQARKRNFAAENLRQVFGLEAYDLHLQRTKAVLEIEVPDLFQVPDERGLRFFPGCR